MKKLFEALKQIKPDISESTLSSIESIFNNAVETAATDKITEMTATIDKYIDTVSESIIISVKENIQEELNSKGVEVAESVDKELKESFEKEIDILTESVDKYVNHATEVYLEQNKKEIVDEAIVNEANQVLEKVGETMGALGVQVESIQNGGAETSKELDEAIESRNKLKTELTVANNKIALSEASINLDVVEASKLTKVMEKELKLDESVFSEKLETMVQVISSSSVEKEVSESKTPNVKQNKTARKITY